MQIEITVHNANESGRCYLTWAPVRCSLRALDGGGEPKRVILGNHDPLASGQLEFTGARNQKRTPTLSVTLPSNGSSVDFFVAGAFPHASREDQDATLSVTRAGTGELLASKAAMVRIRKNADQLTPSERDRFVTALARLNDRGTGAFKDFRAMHRDPMALRQAHGAPGFLSWHRAYLLDLERELQRLDQASRCLTGGSISRRRTSSPPTSWARPARGR